MSASAAPRHDAAPSEPVTAQSRGASPASVPVPSPVSDEPPASTQASSFPASAAPIAHAPAMNHPRRSHKREHSTKGKTNTMNGPLYMQSSNNVVLVRRLKRKGNSPMKQLTRWFVQNQIGFSFNLITLLLLVHACLPKARKYTSRFFSLSYSNSQTGLYGLGSDDGYFIMFCIVLFTGLRAATMDWALAPMAKALGIAKRKDIIRFSEQAWLLVYYVFFWTLGVYLYCTSPYFLNLPELWTNWPSRGVTATMKGYILAQLAFWIQQVLVINIEERRKDHWQMLTHHIITICLIYASYRYHFTRVGNLILVLMDIVDLFFPAAKCLKYSGYHTLSDCMFGVFMVSWFVARHILYMMVVNSIWVDTDPISRGFYKGAMDSITGPYDPPFDKPWTQYAEALWSSTGMVTFEAPVKYTFIGLLLFLQAITIAWFMLIIRVAIRVLRGGTADDPRSDDEADEEETEEEFVYEETQQVIEEDVSVDNIDFKNWERRSGFKRAAVTTATGVSLPGHSDRKELLGRIGCEKQVD